VLAAEFSTAVAQQGAALPVEGAVRNDRPTPHPEPLPFLFPRFSRQPFIPEEYLKMQRTLTIIKPDAVRAGNTGNILAHLQKQGFRILALRQLQLSQPQAQAFYAVHAERPFYGELVDFMTSGPVVPVALERENAVATLREVMGATNSREAAEGTVRNLYGTDIQNNAIHGSDSTENAAIELAFFFPACELV
jgi:nucleoside-diphosphate kinase